MTRFLTSRYLHKMTLFSLSCQENWRRKFTFPLFCSISFGCRCCRDVNWEDGYTRLNSLVVTTSFLRLAAAFAEGRRLPLIKWLPPSRLLCLWCYHLAAWYLFSTISWLPASIGGFSKTYLAESGRATNLIDESSTWILAISTLRYFWQRRYVHRFPASSSHKNCGLSALDWCDACLGWSAELLNL